MMLPTLIGLTSSGRFTFSALQNAGISEPWDSVSISDLDLRSFLLIFSAISLKEEWELLDDKWNFKHSDTKVTKITTVSELLHSEIHF